MSKDASGLGHTYDTIPEPPCRYEYEYEDDYVGMGEDDDYGDDETYVLGDVGDALRWFATENLRLKDELAAAAKRAEDLKNLLTLRERKSGLWL